MTIANQIGLGICLVLIPYLAGVIGSAALSAILDRFTPQLPHAPLHRMLANISFNGIVNDDISGEDHPIPR